MQAVETIRERGIHTTCNVKVMLENRSKFPYRDFLIIFYILRNTYRLQEVGLAKFFSWKTLLQVFNGAASGASGSLLRAFKQIADRSLENKRTPKIKYSSCQPYTPSSLISYPLFSGGPLNYLLLVSFRKPMCLPPV